MMQQFWDTHGPWLTLQAYRIVLAICILALTLLIARQARLRIRMAYTRLPIFDDNFVPVLCTLVSYGLYIIGGAILLSLFDISSASLLTVLGAAGLAIGLSLKNTLSNIAAGIMLLVLRPFERGDSIECGSVQGKVREINLFTTLVDTPDGVLMVASNSSLWGPPIRNLDKRAHRCLLLTFLLRDREALQQAETLLKALLADESRLLADPKPRTTLIKLGPDGAALELRAWVAGDAYWHTFDDLQRTATEQLQAADLLPEAPPAAEDAPPPQ